MQENNDNTQQNQISYTPTSSSSSASQNMKYCKYCGSLILMDAVICTHCGRQVEELKNNSPQGIVINNTANSNINQNPYGFKPKNKWVAFLLCLFLGFWGVHKFYEGKILLGILYIFTLGFFGIGVFIDLIVLLFKPNPYFV